MFIPDPTPTDEQRQLQATARARRIALRRKIGTFIAALSEDDRAAHRRATRQRDRFLSEVGMYPERSLRAVKPDASSMCAGDLRREQLLCGGFDGAAVATERRLTERWADRRRAARGNYKPKAAVDRRHEQSEATRATRKAAWSPEKRAAMSARTASAGKLGASGGRPRRK
jgi:hypothetical protein